MKSRKISVATQVVGCSSVRSTVEYTGYIRAKHLMLIYVWTLLFAGDVFATDHPVYFVPQGFPESESIYIVEDGNDERFCTSGLEGLDLARTLLDYHPCGNNSSGNNDQLVLREHYRNLDALILVDDRSDLSSAAVRLLSGAIQTRFGNSYYVVPFGVELQQRRSSQSQLSVGFQAIVVGERLYQDHYKNLSMGRSTWLTVIDASISMISPGMALAPLEVSMDMETDSVSSAQQSMQHGQNLYVQERYLEAAEAFKAGYQAEPASAFLYNTAVAYERSQDYSQAADFFSRYLIENPGASDSGQVRERIDLLRTRAMR